MHWQSVIGLFGGVGLLLYGVMTMGNSLQTIAGDHLRKLISRLTATPIRGVGVGAVVTMIIQSSTATTVMVVSLVHAGLMTLPQAVGIIMGANIGTTITAQLIAFKISSYALIPVGIGVILTLAGKTKVQRAVGHCLVGFGLMFLGMQTMQNAMSFLQGRRDLFLPFQHYPILALFAGTLVTMLIHSSSATVGLTMAMASQGVISLEVAVAIMLGDNIGTTVTAFIASLAGNRAAKQAAMAHVMFNVIGALIVMPILPFFSALCASTSHDIARQVANSHTIFNVACTLLFLPFVDPYVRLIQKIVPSKGAAVWVGPKYLDTKLIAAAPAAAVEAVRQEMIRMGLLTLEMLQMCRRAIVENDRKMIDEVAQTEKLVNELTHNIVDYAAHLGQSSLSPDLSTILSTCVNGVGDIERIGDHCTNLIEMYEYLLDHKLHFSPVAIGEFKEMFDLVYEAVDKSISSLAKEDPHLAQEVLELEDRVDVMEKMLRARHIERLNRGECQPGAGVVFIDILSNLERVADHAHNVAYVTLDIIKASHARELVRER